MRLHVAPTIEDTRDQYLLGQNLEDDRSAALAPNFSQAARPAGQPSSNQARTPSTSQQPRRASVYEVAIRAEDDLAM
jgi:hypothetical protein